MRATPNNCKGRQEEPRFQGERGSVVARMAKVHTGNPAGVTTAAGATMEPLNKPKVCTGISTSLRANLAGGREAVSSSSCQLHSHTSFLGTEKDVSHCCKVKEKFSRSGI